jgi:gamma-glutamylcyclotransferase (GGCT)/AIG2-like uncharacterized protein YtfP
VTTRDDGAVVPPRLFVYGTLQPGRLRWPLLAPYAAHQRPAAVRGLLYDSGNGWPVAVFEAVDREIPGVLLDLVPDRVHEALELLDGIEGTVSGLLHRVVVSTVDGATAWSYHWPGATAAMRAIDRWDATDER